MLYEKEQIENDRNLARCLGIALMTNFSLYFRQMFYLINNKAPFWLPFHKQIADKLQEYAEQKNTKRNLAICLPVGSGKSAICEYFITWCFARSVNHCFCYVSHSDTLITKLSKECRDIIESPEWQMIFGRRLEADNKSKTNFSFIGAQKRTGLTAGAMGSALTGIDAGVPTIDGFSGALLIDDPLDIGNARSSVELENCVNIINEKLNTRRRTPTTPTILIMQRASRNDFVGWVKENEPEQWDFLEIPALNEETGESFWPERYPLEELEHIRKVNPFKFYSQYQQNPIVDGGGVIKTDWFKYYPVGQEFRYTKRFICADTAQKVKEANDYSVFMVAGVTDNGKLHVLDMVRGKWEAPDLKRQALALWNKWNIEGQPLSGFYIEDKASGTGLIQEFSAQTGIPVLPLKADKDKLTRLEAVLGHIEAGNVLLPCDEGYSFNPALLSECAGFTRDDKHAHDDMVDSLVYCIMTGLSKMNLSILNVLD